MTVMNLENFGLFEKAKHRRLHIWLYLSEMFKIDKSTERGNELVLRAGEENGEDKYSPWR